MRVTEKAWGISREVFYERPSILVCFCEVKSGCRSSMHLHQKMRNRFYVRSGAIRVVTYQQGRLRAKIVRPGQHFDVPAGVLHRFEVIASGSMWETYLPDGVGGRVDREDIARIPEPAQVA